MENGILGPPTSDFYNVRVIQKNLVYVIGIPQKYADEAVLRKQEFFGQFGSIKKVIINRRCDSKLIESTASAYITYSATFEAAWCIQEVDESLLEGKMLRCTYGTTKYCSFYLKNVPCQNVDCMYLHNCRSTRDILTKDELLGTKHKLHDFECKNRNLERLGKKKNFEFLDELIKFKSHNDFKPPKKIIFEPIDFTARRS